MEKNPTATNLKDMDTRRKPTDTDINLINPMVIQVMVDTGK